MKVPASSSSRSNNTQKDIRRAAIHEKGMSVVGRVNSDVLREKRVTLNSSNEIVSPQGKVLMSAGEIARYSDKGLRNMVIMKLNPIDPRQFDTPKTERTDEVLRTPTFPRVESAPKSDGFFEKLARLWCGI